jgi:3-phenylpropionate/cinnamic acid dioxygenase small subunit
MSGIIDAEARAQIEELLARYAHAIDNDLIEDWPLFFIEDGQYLVTTRNLAKGRPVGNMYCDGRGMMQDRVTALRQAIVFKPASIAILSGAR